MSGSLRGPSGEALRELESQLAEALQSVGSRKAAQVGEELFSLAAVLRSEPRLRRMLTDVSVDAAAKGHASRSGSEPWAGASSWLPQSTGRSA